MVSKPEILIDRLARTKDEPPAFVLLWTYVEEHGVTELSNSLTSRGLNPWDLEPYSIPVGSRSTSRWQSNLDLLRTHKRDPLQFQTAIVRLLKQLDLLLAHYPGAPRDAYPGWAGGEYCVLSRASEFIDRLTKGTTLARSDEQIVGPRAHTKWNVVLPAKLKNGVSYEVKSCYEWGDRTIHSDLDDEIKNDTLKVMLYVIQADHEFTDRDVRFRAVTGTREPEKLSSEVKDALKLAHDKSASILVLPELSISEEAEEIIQSELENPDHEYPRLVVFGRFHYKPEDSRRYVNRLRIRWRAGGENNFEHTKILPANFHGKDQDGKEVFFFEDIEYGTKLSLLRGGQLGWLIPLICIDMAAEHVTTWLKTCPPSLIIVPSMCDTNTMHTDAAKTIFHSSGSVIVVANRSLVNNYGEHNRSFMLYPKKKMDKRDFDFHDPSKSYHLWPNTLEVLN